MYMVKKIGLSLLKFPYITLIYCTRYSNKEYILTGQLKDLISLRQNKDLTQVLVLWFSFYKWNNRYLH